MLEPGDPAPEISARNQYGEAFGLDTSGGRVDRYTFVLADGEVKKVYDPDRDDPEGHAKAVLVKTRNEFVRGG
jgi:peroxiredoxin Q/BCP